MTQRNHTLIEQALRMRDGLTELTPTVEHIKALLTVPKSEIEKIEESLEFKATNESLGIWAGVLG